MAAKAKAKAAAKSATKAATKARTAARAATVVGGKGAKGAAKAATKAATKATKAAKAATKAVATRKPAAVVKKAATKAKRAAKAATKAATKARRAAWSFPKKGQKSRQHWAVSRGTGGRFKSRRLLPSFIRGRQRAATKRSKKHLRTIRAIPVGHRVAGLLVRNPYTGEIMRTALVNPGRRYRRRHNPRRRYRRHNPNGVVGGSFRQITAALLPAIAGGGAAGLLDAKVTGQKSVLIRIGAKVLAAGLGGIMLKSNPIRAAAFIGAMLGTAAYEGGLRAAGGLVAVNAPAGIKELASMAAEDEANLGMLQSELRGMGLLEDSGMGDATPDLGDVEPSLGEAEPNLGEDMEDLGDEYE